MCNGLTGCHHAVPFRYSPTEEHAERIDCTARLGKVFAKLFEPLRVFRDDGIDTCVRTAERLAMSRQHENVFGDSLA